MTWTLYLLYHETSKRTYLGVTTNVERRLRQHRCEIVGGARYTTRIQKQFPECKWQLVVTVANFPDQAEVTRWERLLKLRTRGLQSRIEAMRDIGSGRHPKSFTEEQKKKFTVPTDLFVS